MAATASTRYDSPTGTLELQRYPRRRDESLQAWCAADTLLLEAARAHETPASLTLTVNDEHGALTTALGPGALWTDSFLAATATAENLKHNQRDPVPLRWSVDAPGSQLQLVVMRVPKQLPYFEYQLACLTAAMAEGGTLICGGMDKHLSPQTARLIEQYFGPVTRHRGERKARLFSARRGPEAAIPAPPPAHYLCEYLGASLVSQANVFSRESLDIGSRFLIENLHRIAPGEQLVDLACGNGVLGLCALRAGLAQQLTLCDESAMAIASARANARGLGLSGGIELHHGDGFSSIGQQFDRILCNPPFHLGHTVDDFAGQRLLQQCAGQLRPGGQLYVVANRHLDYASSLKRHFPAVKRLAQNKKFIIWSACTG